MSFGIIAGVATGIGASVIGAKSQKKASQAQADAQLQGAQSASQAQEKAAELIYQQFKDTEARLAPYSDAGLPASQKQQALSGALGPEAQQTAYDEYVESPGVAFARERGLRAIDRNAAAQGSLVGGNRDKARIDFAQGLAEQDFSNYFNRLGSITGTGLSAAQAIGGVSGQAAQGQAQMTAGAGQTLGAGQAGAGQSLAAGQMGAAQSYQSGIGALGTGIGQMFEKRTSSAPRTISYEDYQKGVRS